MRQKSQKLDLNGNNTYIEVYTIYRLASDSVFEIDNISNTDPIDSPWFHNDTTWSVKFVIQRHTQAAS